jgi:hypothetical protein
LNRRRILTELGRDEKGRRKTVATLNAERRMRKKIQQMKRELAGLNNAYDYQCAENVRLRRRLAQRESVELPESYLTKVMDKFIEDVASKFARDALANGATADRRHLQYAAEMLARGAMPNHTLFTLETPTFLVEEMIESGDLRFTFTTNGPVSMHWMMSKQSREEGKYTRHIARDPDERFYRLDALPQFIGDYIEPKDTSVKTQRIFFPH